MLKNCDSFGYDCLPTYHSLNGLANISIVWRACINPRFDLINRTLRQLISTERHGNKTWLPCDGAVQPAIISYCGHTVVRRQVDSAGRRGSAVATLASVLDNGADVVGERHVLGIALSGIGVAG